jgi:hypothetical protein
MYINNEDKASSVPVLHAMKVCKRFNAFVTSTLASRFVRIYGRRKSLPVALE